MVFLIALGVLGLVIAAFSYYVYRETERDRREVMERGQPFVAYALLTHDEMYRPGDSHGAASRILIAFEPESPELHAALGSLTSRMQELTGRQPRTQGEWEVLPLVKDTSFRTGRIPIRAELTGGRLVYSYDGYIERALLPGGQLEKPYIHCVAVPGDKGNIYMTPSPDAERGSSRPSEFTRPDDM